MKVIKRDGREVPFDTAKIIVALEGANRDVGEDARICAEEMQSIAGRIRQRCDSHGRAVSVEEIQDTGQTPWRGCAGSRSRRLIGWT